MPYTFDSGVSGSLSNASLFTDPLHFRACFYNDEMTIHWLPDYLESDGGSDHPGPVQTCLRYHHSAIVVRSAEFVNR